MQIHNIALRQQCNSQIPVNNSKLLTLKAQTQRTAMLKHQPCSRRLSKPSFQPIKYVMICTPQLLYARQQHPPVPISNRVSTARRLETPVNIILRNLLPIYPKELLLITTNNLLLTIRIIWRVEGFRDFRDRHSNIIGGFQFRNLDEGTERAAGFQHVVSWKGRGGALGVDERWHHGS